MEKTKNIFLTVILVLVAGCATPTVSHRDVVLVESEIPWQMTEGQYVATDGTRYVVDATAPRWSVSEAWMFNTFSGIDTDKDGFFNKLCVRTAIVVIAISAIILLLIIRFAAWRYR